VNKKPNNNMKK